MEEINNFDTSIMSKQLPINNFPFDSSQPKRNVFKLLSFIFLVLFISTLIIFSCYVAKSKKEISVSQNQIAKNNTLSNTAPILAPEKINLLKISDIQIELPLEWVISSVSDNTVKILTDNQKYKVYLILNFNKNNTNAERSYQNKDISTKTQYGEVFGTDASDNKGITGAIINNNKYSFEWGIESNQTPPVNFNGIWRPDDDVTPEMLLNITKTARPLIPSTTSINTTPDKVALNFYQEYIKNGQDFTRIQNSPYLTSECITKLNKIYLEMVNLGEDKFDAILLTQNTPTTFSAKVIKQDDASAIVNLTESNGWTKTLVVSLVVFDGQWKINSIVESSNN